MIITQMIKKTNKKAMIEKRALGCQAGVPGTLIPPEIIYPTGSCVFSVCLILELSGCG